MPRLILASSSPYRRALLQRLGLPFEHLAPDINEAPQPDESAHKLTRRLALAKAQALQEQFSAHLIIGSDQVVMLDGQLVSKPGNHAAACEQLHRCSGRTVEFTTSVCLLNSQTGSYQLGSEVFKVSFRQLDTDSIERYLQREQPYDCAGSFKAEALGITLFRSMSGDDPNSLIGLPLIRLCEMLRQEGLQLP